MAKYKLPPGPTPFPLIGNIHQLGDQPHLSLNRLSQKYGPLMLVYLGQIPTVIISGAKAASEVLRNQDHLFCNRKPLTATERFSYGGIDIAFAPHDDHWKQLRKLSNSEVFGPARVQSFQAIRREEVRALVSTIRRGSSSATVVEEVTVNLSEMLLCFFNNLIFRKVFGKRVSADGECDFTPHQGLLRDVVELMADFAAKDLFPSMGWIDVLTGWRAKLERAFRKMDQLFEVEIEQRMQSTNNGQRLDQPPTRLEYFLDILLRLQDEEEGKISVLSRKEIKAILMNMFTAGTDTAAATVEWAMTHLMKNPEVMKKASEEVRRVACGKAEVEECDLQHLHYLKLVIKETLRMSPPAPLLPTRECIQDTQINGYDIPAKTVVLVCVWSTGKDPSYWDDPETFRPERFENSPINFKGSHFEFTPFGSGRRMCPGITLAMAGIELVLANILFCFNWNLPKGVTAEDVDMKAQFGIVTTKKEPLLLVARQCRSI
ncbi:hypothetical protein HPP92_015638 [Vanilla planifolia]|uniref:Cytochrome P450 n=1 Tax=Vanilla planifolia TaxID=51239 RepID=A0A835QLJ3_VANPL|nr:hypothetical protein HPP92_015638 [Vanilla planifolia]